MSTLRVIPLFAVLGMAAASPLAQGKGRAPTFVTSVSSARQVTDSTLDHSMRARSATIDLSALRLGTANRGKRQAPDIAPELHFELFPDVVFDAKSIRIKQDGFGTTTWVGRVEGRKDSQVIITSDGDSVFGHVDIGFNQYTFRGTGSDGVVVSEVDPRSYRYYMDDTDEFVRSIASESGSKKSGSGSYMLNSVTSGHTVDVLVFYTQSACFRMGCLNPAPFVENLIEDNNQAYINGSVNGAARVVGYELISGYSEPNKSGTAAEGVFSELRQYMEDGSGYFSDVPSLRDDYHADVGILFVDGTKLHDGPCGVTRKMNNGPDNDDRAFIVLSTECAIGDRTFTHEIGHVLAGRHDSDLGYHSDNPYTTDFGYSSASPQFHTILGQESLGGACGYTSGCARINRWSSPTQSYSGASLGTSIHDSVHNEDYSTDMVDTLYYTVPIVAAYRSPSGLSVPGTPGSIQAYDCDNTTHVNWGSASGTVGWYEADTSTSSSFSNPMQIYKGPGGGFSNHFTTSTYVRVHACNAAGCGSYTQALVQATGPTCNPL